MMPSLAAPLLAAGNGFLLRRMFTHGAAVRGAFSAGDLQRYVNAARRPGALRAGLSYYRANARLGLQTTPLPRITAPTLVIWGERDPALGVELLHGLEDVTTTLRVERLPGIGHWVQNEAADRVTALLLEFLRSHPGEPVHPSRARQGVTFRHCPSFETRSQIRDNVEATVVSSSPSTFPVSRRLSELSVGTIAQLHEVHLDSEARSVLRGLGLTDASILRVCKQGEPCVVQVHATRIGISSRVARQIMVRPQDDVPGARS
jgi:Fe2+ transport system protein FeoA